MKNGVPIIDRQAAMQSPAGQMALGESFLGKTGGRLLREHLPGEQGSPSIMEVEPSEQDNVARLCAALLKRDTTKVAAGGRKNLSRYGFSSNHSAVSLNLPSSERRLLSIYWSSQEFG